MEIFSCSSISRLLTDINDTDNPRLFLESEINIYIYMIILSTILQHAKSIDTSYL